MSFAALAAGCIPRTSGTALHPPAAVTFGDETAGQIAVHASGDKPIVTTVVRDGDPSGAVAASVLTDGDGIASTALAALVESRMRVAGISTVETRADRDGYRVFALAATPQQAAEFVAQFYDALAAPVTTSSPAVQLAAQRLDALRAHPLDSPALVPVLQCTGELGSLPSDPWFDPTSAQGLARLEQLRRVSHVRERVSIGAVGQAPITQQVVRAVHDGPAWPSGSLPQDPWPDQDSITAYSRSGNAELTPKLQLAVRVRGAFTAIAVAERSARADSPLLARVAATDGWRVSRISTTVRPRGACLSLVLDRTDTPSTNLETDAARVAALVANELETSFSEVRSDGSVAGRQVLRASDPREAASLAAWWSQTSRLQPGPDRVALALGLPPPRLVPNAPVDAIDKLDAVASQRFSAAYRAAHTAWDKPVVDARTDVEAGQGELWLLAASPCGVLAETDSESGTTALAAVAAALPGAASNGVTLEPWVAQDGVGILAHAPPRPGEGPHSLARRVADAAAHALVQDRISDADLSRARSTVLALIDPPDASFSPAVGAFARSLVPGHPSWLVPFGLRGRVVEAGSAAVDLRWAALSDGPIRMSVLANVDANQAATAVRSLDRWLVRSDEHARSCSPVPPADAPTAVQLTGDSHGDTPRALVGVVIMNPDRDSSTMLELLVEALNGPGGWLDHSLASFGTHITATARALGAARAQALVIDIRGPDPMLDPAMLQVRAVLDRIARGAATRADLQRAQVRLASHDRESALDPRARLISLWRATPAARPSTPLPAWNAWLARSLAADRISSLRWKLEPPAATEDVEP